MVITKGEDFDGNSLVGIRAIVINALTPTSKDAYIKTEQEPFQVLFYPKDWMKVVKRNG